VWDQFSARLPPHPDAHPLGCHRPRLPDRVVVDTLVQGLVVGGASWRIAAAAGSATTLRRRRRDEGLAAGIMDQLASVVDAACDQMLGLALEDLAVDGGLTEAPCGGELAGRSPVDRGTSGRKRATIVAGNGLPLGPVVAPAARHDSPLLDPTRDGLERFTPVAEPPTVHLDRGDDAALTRERLAQRELVGEISPTGKPAPLAATGRWVIERTHAWTTAHKTLVWCTERRDRVIVCWLPCSAVRITVGRLVRAGWTRSRWDDRPRRKP